MNKIKIGVLCPSEIAFRRFMPAISDHPNAEYIGIASASGKEWFGEDALVDDAVIENERLKTQEFVKTYGGKTYPSYHALITSAEVDAIYLPLPPALHYRWAEQVLKNRKHILLEKPATTSFHDTKSLIRLAEENDLAIHENYMFLFHSQIAEIEKIIQSGKLGDVRLYRISFGFPRREKNDFRYKKALGGGALLDCGGYTLKLAQHLLGKTAKIVYSQQNNVDGFEVDIYGSAALVNDRGVTAQIAYGMDNAYQCKLEVWGSKGYLSTGRILTAPVGFTPTATIEIGGKTETVCLSTDDTFKKSISKFCECISSAVTCAQNHADILDQARLVEQMKEGFSL